MITTGNWQDALEPIARKNFQVGLKEIPAERDMLFDVTSSDKLTETYLELGDIGPMEEFSGSLPYDDVAQGYKMTITNREFAKGIKIQRKFARVDQLDIVKSLPKMLGLAARRRIASDVFFGYNNAFNTSITTLDGLQLCSSAHTSNQESITTTQSNRGTSAFSAVAVEAARIAMKKFLTNKDGKFEVMPDLLLVPRDLEEAAYELVNSSGKVDTANNNKNFHSGKYKVLASDWLDDTNNWFFIDSDLLKQFAIWQNVDPVDFRQAEDFDGLVAKYLAYMFYGFGFRDWRFVYGSEVS
jgi:phage major head subunit gpT-like protein